MGWQVPLSDFSSNSGLLGGLLTEIRAFLRVWKLVSPLGFDDSYCWNSGLWESGHALCCETVEPAKEVVELREWKVRVNLCRCGSS